MLGRVGHELYVGAQYAECFVNGVLAVLLHQQGCRHTPAPFILEMDAVQLHTLLAVVNQRHLADNRYLGAALDVEFAAHRGVEAFPDKDDDCRQEQTYEYGSK